MKIQKNKLCIEAYVFCHLEILVSVWTTLGIGSMGVVTAVNKFVLILQTRHCVAV